MDVGRVAGLRTARQPNGRVAAGWTGTADGPGPTAGPAATAWSVGDAAVTTAVAQQAGSDPACYAIIYTFQQINYDSNNADNNAVATAYDDKVTRNY